MLDGDATTITDSSSFCYPSIIITGAPKCSTSAMFALLSSVQFISSNKIKENCLFVDGIDIITYFLSLPKTILPNHYYIDGCIDLVGNMMLRRILRIPNTFYIVMVRNYADMIWSAVSLLFNSVFVSATLLINSDAYSIIIGVTRSKSLAVVSRRCGPIQMSINVHQNPFIRLLQQIPPQTQP
jgi:hypothetical protein